MNQTVNDRQAMRELVLESRARSRWGCGSGGEAEAHTLRVEGKTHHVPYRSLVEVCNSSFKVEKPDGNNPTKLDRSQMSGEISPNPAASPHCLCLTRPHLIP